MHTWHWHTWQGLPYLTCSLLQDWQHGFFTQQFWTRSPADLVEVLHPTAEVYRVKQVHGNTVLSASEAEPTPQENESGFDRGSEPAANPSESDHPMFRDADGLLTEQSDQAVWVCTADCTPVLIADEATGQVAAIHAGWRGTALKIVPQAIRRMQAQGSQIKNLRVAMGPAITGEVYQVSTEVAAQVGATVVPHGIVPGDFSHPSHLESANTDAIDSTAILDVLQQLPQSPIRPDPEPGRARLDVRRVNALQLEQLGLAEEQVSIAPYCTYQTPDLFFSYRRSSQKRVQWSGIVSRNE
ncbi:MAG TPA: peptidoglycan editing factor PgeF [Allocoleopsis sp.]